MIRIHVTGQLGLYDPWMDGGSPDTPAPMPLIEGNRKQDIRGLGTAVSDERFVRGSFKVRIFQVNIGETVTGGRNVDEPGSRAQQGRNPVDQDKVAKMIGAELPFETVRGMLKRCLHHARICDDQIKGLPLG